ncbi:uncharacterized protein LOC143151987 isoform X1 [Ptiloglossa arizonensis]|uniref:uncharacterized protein LOC143151987 isoform X1 n=1 Tax=Ptiloglossa arizonensis TaxID=3350558 RepID=UPI003FA0B030
MMENRLCLKSTNLKKYDCKSICKELVECNIKHSADESKMDEVVDNDSILDFKSPESKIIKPRLSEFNKFNIAKQKRKTTLKLKNSVNQKEMKFEQHSEEIKNLQKFQPTIESSFFKSKNDCANKAPTTNAKVALVCPLCFKTFKDSNCHLLHMKMCATKNNISTRKLLDALELQKHQEDERKSLGLPAAPVIPVKKKSVSSRNNLHQDFDLELALVLSKSLQEAEELEEINDIKRLSNAPNQSKLKTRESINNKSLENFGFAISKPISFIKNKKKKHNKITVLQTRSQEERDQILTERIAEILIGNESVTQKQREESECSQKIKMEIVLKSHLLQELYCKDGKLWDKARLTPNQRCFYVTNLSEYIIPQEKQIDVEEEKVMKFINMCKIDDINLNQNKIEVCRNKNKSCEIPQTNLCFTNQKYKNCEDEKYINTLVINWGNALNDSSASDVILFVNNDKYIWAHKLVFYVRCSNILLDVIPNDTSQFIAIREKICWLDISYNIALAFLEFIYCGIIKKYWNIFKDLTSFCSLRNLARKYKVKELFSYLQIIEDETKQIHGTKDIECKKTLIMREKDNMKLNLNNLKDLIHDRKADLILGENKKSNEKHLEAYIASKSGSSEVKLKNAASPILNITTSVVRNLNTEEIQESTSIERLPQEEVDCLSKININSHYNTSPEMFDDINHIMPNHKEKFIDEIADVEKMKKDENFSIFACKNVEMYINSLSNTPHSSRSKDRNLSHSNIIKGKSNLSLFIEQFQIENAKSDFDTDSEDTVISVSPKLNRNPFKIKQHDDSNRYSMSNGNAFVEKTLKKKKNVLINSDYINKSSKLDLETTYKDSNTNMHLSFDSMDNLMELLEFDVEMKKDICSPEEKVHNEVTLSMSKDLLKQNVNVKDSNDIVNTEACIGSEYIENQNNTSPDFNIDENEISMYTRYKKKHRNNSIVKYRDFITKHVLNTSMKNNTEYEYKRENNMDNEDITVLSDIDIGTDFLITAEKNYSNQIEKKQLTFNTEKSMPTPEQNEQNDSYKNYFPANITSPISTQKSILKFQRANNSSELRCNKSKSNVDMDVMENNLLISLTQPTTSKSDSRESPLLISSSPELDFDVLNENKVNNNISNFKESDDNSYIFEKDIYLANVYINDDDDNKSTSLSVINGINHLTECNFSYVHDKEKESSAVINNENTELSIPNNQERRKESRNKEKSLIVKQGNRKFQRKSMSETNLHINTKGSKNNVSDFYNGLNQSQCKCGRKKLLRTITSSTIIRDNIIPSPNYNNMKTPELHAELHKYGLKIQKRNKAVKLLTYIYNELHPTIATPEKVESEFAIISSDEEGPPIKKRSIDTSDVNDINDYKYEQISQNSTVIIQSPIINIINEGRQFDKLQSTTAIDNTPNIKDVFSKLIKVNRELHNNILAYEPLCIESLHSLLKEEGFRCKINVLANFLDKQCITFYFQETKLKKNKKK